MHLKIHFKYPITCKFNKKTFSYRYSPDQSLLKLQAIAKNNHLGSIWSGITKDFVLGFDSQAQDDISLLDFQEFDQARAEAQGFPLILELDETVHRFEPWYERKAKKELECARRIDYRRHQELRNTTQYGFQIEMENL